MSDTIVLYRPTGPNELALVEASGFRRWPPRLPDQPIFYPVTNEAYAIEIASRWNTRGGKVGWWIPADQLDQLNDHIVGAIEVIGTYHAPA